MEGVSLMRKKMTASIIAAVLAVTAAVTGKSGESVCVLPRKLHDTGI
jgi:phenylpyruvate tautomerase PptA (4-oxalocrotonate tautomerase family)